jgi:hypothetical protein
LHYRCIAGCTRRRAQGWIRCRDRRGIRISGRSAPVCRYWRLRIGLRLYSAGAGCRLRLSTQQLRRRRAAGVSICGGRLCRAAVPNRVTPHEEHSAKSTQSQRKNRQHHRSESDFPVSHFFRGLKYRSAKISMHIRLSGSSLSFAACRSCTKEAADLQPRGCSLLIV